MTQYTTLLEQLQSQKRQQTALRKKCISLESDNTILRDSERALKSALQTIKQTAARLQKNNESLVKQNQRLVKEYETQFLAVKSEITKKQQSMKELQIAMQNNVINVGLVRRQIECQVQAKFFQQIERKDSRLNQLQAKYDSLKREKQVDKEKNDIKIRALESALKESEDRHLQEIKEYANKLYQQSQRKVVNSEDSMLKRLRRELDCLRNILTEKDGQIQSLLIQKSQLLEHNTAVRQNHQKSNQQLLQELTSYKRSMDEQKNQQSLEIGRQQNAQVKSMEREVKKYKEEYEHIKEQLEQKQKRIEQLKCKQKQTEVQIQNIERKARKKYEQKVHELEHNRSELESKIRQIQKQEQYYKNKYNSVIATNNKQQFRNTINRRQDNINRRYQSNDKNNEQIHYSNKNHENTENINRSTHQNTNKRQDHNTSKKIITNEENITEQKNIKNIKKVYNQLNDHVQDNRSNKKNKKYQQMNEFQAHDLNKRNLRNYQDQQQDERQNIHKRNRYHEEAHDDLSKRQTSPIDALKIQKQRDKVREIARKYLQLQQKYDKCKKKLDQANSKVLQLIRNKIAMVSPPKTINQGMHFNSHGKTDPEAYTNHKNGDSLKNKQQKNRLKQLISSTGQHFYRSSSPKHNKFYEKSLSFKSKNKTKDLRCMNHDHEDEAEQDCQHQNEHKYNHNNHNNNNHNNNNHKH